MANKIYYTLVLVRGPLSVLNYYRHRIAWGTVDCPSWHSFCLLCACLIGRLEALGVVTSLVRCSLALLLASACCLGSIY